MHDGQYLTELNGHTDEITSAVFSPDDQQLLSASKDSTAIIWNYETGDPLFHLTDHKLAINCAVFNTDGTEV